MRVLIVEDDPVSRRLLQSYLQKWGHEVVAAHNGVEAWKLFQAEIFPIVISDWMMPEMDGVDLIRRIRGSQRPDYTYTILLTAKSNKEDVVEGMDAGADDFVTKPFDRDELRVRLREGERIIRLERDLASQNRALRETQTALVQSEKLASLGQLAAGMAHEINNPLSYVTNNLAVLRRDAIAAMSVLEKYREGRGAWESVNPKLAAEASQMEEDADLNFLQENLDKLFQKSLDGLQRVREIVKNLRDFARLDEAELKECDLNAGVLSTIEILKHELNTKSIQIDLQLAPLPAVFCHPGKINQVFLNLLLNAIQASQPNGRIGIRSQAGPKDVVFEFQDEGSGIKPEHLGHIFEPFFTTKPQGQGMGLGLSVGYGIVRDHGGAIEVDSTPGKGSTFRIRLPLEVTKKDDRRAGS